MTDERRLDLADLTLDAARTLVGQDFVRPNDTGPDVVLRLAEVESTRRDPTAAADATGRPFSLLFHGPADPRLTQGMHDLEHPESSLRGIFLVPVGQNESGFSYEAVFS